MDAGDVTTPQEGDVKNGFPVDVGVLLGVFVGALVWFQYTTLHKFSVLKPAVRFVLSRDIINHIQAQVLLGVGDAMLFVFIASLFLCGVGLEIWRGRLTVLMRWVFATERRTVVSLLLLCVVCVRFYFAKGVLNWAGDGSSHMCYAWLASQSFAKGEVPIWTNYLGAGSPYLQFYGFLFFYTVGVLDQLIRDLDVTMKVVLASAHVVSGLGMYFFVRRLLGTRRAAFVAGLAYVLCVWHMQQVLMMGRFPLSLFYAILPWPFYSFERLRLGKKDGIVWGGLLLGALAFVHPGYAFWATAAWAFYAGIRVVCGWTRLSKQVLAFYGFLLWLLGLVFGAYVTVPMWVERAHVELEEITHAAVPDPTWGHLFVWSNYRIQLFDYAGHEHWYGGYLGLSLVVLGVLGLGLKQKSLRSVVWASAACWLVSFVLVLGYRWPGIGSLALVQAFNAGRYLLFVAFFGAVMAGVGTYVLMRVKRARALNIVTWVLLIILVDLGTATFQHPFAKENHTFLSLGPSFYAELEADKSHVPPGQIPNFRLSYPMDNMFDLLGIAWFTTQMGIPSYLTGYREGLPAQSLFCGPVQDVMNGIFEDPSIVDDLRMTSDVQLLLLGLYLLNTKLTYVLESNTQQLIRVAWPYQSPLVVAPHIRVLQERVDENRVARLRRIIGLMQINVHTHTSEAILLAEGEQAEALGTQPKLEVLAHQVWNQRVAFDVRVSAACFARLAYAYYPYLGVYINGKQVKPYQTAGGFIAVKLEAGVHEIELRPYLSPLRRFFWWVDVLILVGVGIGWWKRRRCRVMAEGI